jgi:CBS domain-containing protein
MGSDDMLVSDVMNSDVKTIEPGEDVLEAVSRMIKFRVGCLVVIKAGKLMGILTDSDILEKVVAEDKKASGVIVKDVMTKELIMIEHDKDISEAADIMDQHNVKKLPVIKGKTLVGILTAADLAKAQPKLIEKISSLMVFPKSRKNVAG